MSKIFLLGHTGSVNRGCEAIVRSTVKLFNAAGIYDIELATYNKSDDVKAGLDKICCVREYRKVKKYAPAKITGKICSSFFKQYMPEEKLMQGNIFERITDKDIVLIIGGDTYCYERPVSCYAANRLAKKKGALTVFWGCSLEDSLITDEMMKDLMRYDYICPREEISYNTLLKRGIPKERIICVSDPAFHLNKLKTDYPEIMDNNMTIGINVSPVIFRSERAKKAVMMLIEHILNDTEYNVVLIPHVYNKKGIDLSVLNTIYEQYKPNPKINIISSEMSCENLKYIISKCRMFIGARTHSTIAAYSTGVPTLVLGYSVKSNGIATDLFGEFKDYVIMQKEAENHETLLNAFNKLCKNEDNIRNTLNNILPEYKSRSVNAVETLKSLKDFETGVISVFDKNNCSGCGACALSCPQQCIEMNEDAEGFYYPHINKKACINCGLCKRVCHCMQRAKMKKVTGVYGAVNKNEQIREMSSSGGVFHAAAAEILSRHGIVYGAGYNEKYEVVHKCAENNDELTELMGSKYVQSFLGNVYKSVKEHLCTGRWVLFSGTPCQVDGLYKYLGNEKYTTLITIDFICHGVPSPLTWKSYLKEMTGNSVRDIKNIYFRSKVNGWKTFSMKIDTANGSYVGKVTEDKYLRTFLTDISLRQSCNKCNAKGAERSADITIADFWGVQRIKPEYNDDKGVSLIITRGTAADELLNSISQSMDLFEVNINDVKKTQPSLEKSAAINKLRANFFKDIGNKSFSVVYEKYCGMKVTARLRRKLRNR